MKRASFGSGDPRMWAGIHGADAAAIKSAQKKSGRTRLQVRALADLDLPETATALEIRERYSEYVKRFHPDVNGGDRSSERNSPSDQSLQDIESRRSDARAVSIAETLTRVLRQFFLYLKTLLDFVSC